MGIAEMFGDPRPGGATDSGADVTDLPGAVADDVHGVAFVTCDVINGLRLRPLA